jgi:hypothetical protein
MLDESHRASRVAFTWNAVPHHRPGASAPASTSALTLRLLSVARERGQQWATETANRTPKRLRCQAWPANPRALALARRWCADLSADVETLDELAAAALSAGAAWWREHA